MKLVTLLKKQFFTVFLLSSVIAFAQKAQTPDFKYNLGSIKWMKMTDAGTFLVSTSNGIYGIKPNEAQPAFLFDKRKNIKEENFHLQPGTPYAMFVANGMNGKTFVLDVVTGKVLFDSKADGFTFIYSRNYVLPENKLVINGIRKLNGKLRGAGNTLAVYDLSTGKEEYTIRLKANNHVSGQPKIFNGKLIVPRTKGLDMLDLATGKILWSAKLKNIGFVNIKDDAIYAFQNDKNKKKSTVYKVSASGEILWAKGNKLKGLAAQVEILPEGIAILAHKNKRVNIAKGFSGARMINVPEKSYIYFLDKNTGKDLWEKAPKVKSVVTHFYALKDGILFGQSAGGINKIKFNGTPLWRKPLKTGAGIITLAKTDKGLLYITGSDANIVDENSGDSVLGKKLKYKKSKAVASTYDKVNKRFLLSCSAGLYSIDANSGKVKIIAKPKFGGKEMPTSIEMRGENILLTSSQNMMLLDAKGKEIYKEFYKAPGTSTFGKILGAAVAISAATLAASASYSAGANRTSFGRYNSHGSKMNNYSKGFAGIAGASFGVISKRFKASAQTQNDKFILTKLKSGVGLVKLNKNDGKKIKEILLKDKKPTYKINSIDRILYYKANKKTIYAYKI